MSYQRIFLLIERDLTNTFLKMSGGRESKDSRDTSDSVVSGKGRGQGFPFLVLGPGVWKTVLTRQCLSHDITTWGIITQFTQKLLGVLPKLMMFSIRTLWKNWGASRKLLCEMSFEWAALWLLVMAYWLKADQVGDASALTIGGKSHQERQAIINGMSE